MARLLLWYQWFLFSSLSYFNNIICLSTCFFHCSFFWFWLAHREMLSSSLYSLFLFLRCFPFFVHIHRNLKPSFSISTSLHKKPQNLHQRKTMSTIDPTKQTCPIPSTCILAIILVFPSIPQLWTTKNSILGLDQWKWWFVPKTN